MERTPIELSDKDLGLYLKRFPVDQKYQVPMLTNPADILQLHRMLMSPLFRKPGIDHMEDFYQKYQDAYTPISKFDCRTQAPYCPGAEGFREGDGWTALVYKKRLHEIATMEIFSVKNAQFDGDVLVDAVIVDAAAKVALKKDWNEGRISEPSGCYFDDNETPFIVSPPVIAMYYDLNHAPHFYYDKRRLKRRGPDAKADGFVWVIRHAIFDEQTKEMVKKFIDTY